MVTCAPGGNVAVGRMSCDVLQKTSSTTRRVWDDGTNATVTVVETETIGATVHHPTILLWKYYLCDNQLIKLICC